MVLWCCIVRALALCGPGVFRGARREGVGEVALAGRRDGCDSTAGEVPVAAGRSATAASVALPQQFGFVPCRMCAAECERAVSASSVHLVRTQHIPCERSEITNKLTRRALCSDILEELEEPAESAEVRLKIKADDFKRVADNTVEAFTAWLADGAGGAWQVDEPNFEGVRVKVRLHLLCTCLGLAVRFNGTRLRGDVREGGYHTCSFRRRVEMTGYLA